MGLELLIGCFVVSGMLMTVPRAIADVIETVKAANAGQWDVIDRDRDRRAARTERWGKTWSAMRAKRHRQAGGTGQFKPGARAYLGDVYTGWWSDRIANRQAKRAARGPVTWTAGRKPWHERVDDAVFAAGRKVRDAWQGGHPKPPADHTTTPNGETPVSDSETRPGPPLRPGGSAGYFPPERPNKSAAPRSGSRKVRTPSSWTPYDDDPIQVGIADAAHAEYQRKASPTQGDTMTQPSTTSGATGDVYNVETAIAECNALDDDLTTINTALDVIDERIDAAGTAAEGIEEFLAQKHVDEAFGGMRVARDMLSPTHIKALMDAIAVAKQGVRNALAELVRLQELESQLNGADGSVLNGR